MLIAGQFEESCYTDPINFFCNFDADGIPSDATYYLRLDKNSDEVPLTIVSQFAMPSTLTETELMTAAFPRPMLTVNGSDEVTKLEWQWYRRGGVTTMSDSEVLESIDIWVGSDGTQLIRSGLEIEYGDENTEVEWTWTDGSTKNGDGFVIEGNISSGSIDIPNIPINQINSLDFYYYDPIGNNRRFEWSGNPESE